MEIIIDNRALLANDPHLYKNFEFSTNDAILRQLNKIGMADDEEMYRSVWTLWDSLDHYLNLFFVSRNDDLETFFKVCITDPNGTTTIKLD